MPDEQATETQGAGTAATEPPALATPTSVADLQPKMRVKGVVKRIELYGAFIDLGVGVDAIIHISQLGNRRVNRVADVLEVGQEVEVWVDSINPGAGQITVSMVEPLAVDWDDMYEGQRLKGTVTRLENFGAFVDIGAEKDGLVHISEISHGYIKHPSEMIKVGDEVEVKVLSFKKRKRRINLSMKALQDAPAGQASVDSGGGDFVDDDEEMEELPTAMEIAIRRAMGSDAPPSRQQQKGRRKRAKGRQQQEDIISRTLDLAND